ncbi:hypothetical protein OG395_44375 [Streptomyces sp. NBC_01320]|nr:hypothetical protein OG395_44375 [Streptomyces sp. NBC_01320]
MHPRCGSPRPLRRDDGRRRGARPGLLSHERRGSPTARTLGRKSRHGNARCPRSARGTDAEGVAAPRPCRRRTARCRR